MDERTSIAPRPPHGRETGERGTLPARKGKDASGEARKLKVIGKKPMIDALERALARGFERCFPSLRTHQTRLFGTVVKEEFSKLLGRRGKRIRGQTKSGFLVELQRSRDQVLLQRDAAREELLSLRDKSKVLQDILESDQSTYATHGNLFAADEDKLKDRLRELFSAAHRGTLPRRELERRVVETALGWGREEREQAFNFQRDGQEKQVFNYERRIAKLVETVRGNERELERLERLKNTDSGVPSIYREVQGLEGGESEFGEKLAVLQQVFEANMELRAHRARAGAVPG